MRVVGDKREMLKSEIAGGCALGIGATQTLYNRDVMLAAKTAKNFRRYAAESVDSARIDLVVDVSKAYYALRLKYMKTDE